MKRFSSIIITLALMFCFVLPAQAEYQDFWATVYRWTGTSGDGKMILTPVTTGITYKVLATGANTAETTYVHDSFTTLTNPVTTTYYASTGGKVAFRCDPTDTTYDRYVDLIVVDTAGGYTAVVKNFDKYQHSIVIDERPDVVHRGIMWWTGSTTASDSTNLGITFGIGTQLRALALEVITAISGQTISVGRNGSNTSMINKGLLTSTGFITTSATSTGSDLGSATLGLFYPNGYAFTAATTLYYTVTSNGGHASLYPAGYLHYIFTRGR